MIKPFVLMIVHREYDWLNKNIQRFNNLKSEFSIEPELIVLWEKPIDEDRKIFKKYKAVDGLLESNTLNKSQNIRFGLNYIKSIYHNSYCIVQYPGISIKKNTYHDIDGHIQSGYNIVLTEDPNFYGAYSTDFFAVGTANESYWPPVLDQATFDTIERQWWLKLGKNPIHSIIYKDQTKLFNIKKEKN